MGLADIDRDLGISAIDKDLAQPGTGNIPSGAVPGSPGTNPLTPSWAVPFAGQPGTGGREAAARLAGAAGYTATGGMAGLPGVAARVGVGAGTGGIRGGIQGSLEGALLNALIEGLPPAVGAMAKIAPWPLSGLRNLLPMRPAVTETGKTWSHSPWVGQSVAPDMTQLMLQGPVLARNQNMTPDLLRLMIQRSGAPTVHSGPVSSMERSVTQPAREYMPNQPPFVRMLEEYLLGNSIGQMRQR